LAFQLINKINRQILHDAAISEDKIKARLFKEMMRLIKTSGPVKTGGKGSKVAAFVGPTGVGKTTTVAKLAAELSLNQKKEVALLTLDTYRIAAVEQLKVYSNIIDIPISVARDREEFHDALQLYGDKDIVLIDTAGRSRKDEKQMKELMDYLSGDIPVEVHLVLSSTDQEEILFSNIKRFHPLSVNSLIFTKIDEANSFGMLFNIAVKTNKPISYFTTGQKVPEDIEVATAEKTVDLIFQ
jgi:flagellar biosynthesis protein FlhF